MSIFDRDIVVSKETEDLLREAGFARANLVVSPSDGPLDTPNIREFHDAAMESFDRVQGVLDDQLAEYREPTNSGDSTSLPGVGTRNLKLEVQR